MVLIYGPITIGNAALTLEDDVRVARGGTKVGLDTVARESAAVVQKFVP